MEFFGRCAVVLLSVVSITSTAKAQTAPDAVKLFSSSSDVQALIAKAKSERKDNAPLVSEPILALAPYKANLEYRASIGTAAIHDTEAEFFYVIQGSATMVTGGTLVNPTHPSANNVSGTAIEGGTPRTVSPGDFILVPQGTAHWFSTINDTLILMTLHVPRTQTTP
jgi:mannose-6-phosphate isomerase-like protein (cupin superfamily)